MDGAMGQAQWLQGMLDMRAALLASILLTWAGCSWKERRAPIRVDVTPVKERILLTFSFCDGRREPPTLKLLEIVEPLPHGSVREKCSVSRRSPGHTLPRSWWMGAPADGFEIERCMVLDSGEYSVAVLGDGQFGRTKFRLASRGSVKILETACD